MTLLNTWWILALASGAGLATRNLLFKGASLKLDGAFAALILSLAMTGVTVVYYVIRKSAAGQNMIPSEVNWSAVWVASLAGAGVAFANITLALAYKAGGYASLTALLQNGFSLCVTIIIGALLLGEVIRPAQFAGIALVFIGIVLITRG